MSGNGVSSRSEAMRVRWSDPAFRASMTTSIKNRMALVWADPEFRERRAEQAREDLARRMMDPAYRARTLLALHGADAQRQAENRAKSVAKIREKWADPEWSEKRRAELRTAMLKRREDPAFVANLIEKRRLCDPVVPSRRTIAKRIARAVAAGVVVPGWVPHDLARTYLAIAGHRDEIEAAAEVRRIKRERAGT